MRLCSAMRSNASGRGARKPLVSARGGVLMAFAMALNREGDCIERYEFSLVSYRALGQKNRGFIGIQAADTSSER